MNLTVECSMAIAAAEGEARAAAATQVDEYRMALALLANPRSGAAIAAGIVGEQWVTSLRRQLNVTRTRNESARIDDERPVPISLTVQWALKRMRGGERPTETSDILVALLEEPASGLRQMLARAGFEVDSVVARCYARDGSWSEQESRSEQVIRRVVSPVAAAFRTIGDDA